MSLPKTYDHRSLEARWLERWTDQDLFRVETPTTPVDRFVIVIPPPNVTGTLHIGHALNNILQDIFIRWARMRGRRALWVPGMDHAGIATQNVIERQLAREGKTRFDLGRAAFVEQVWRWKEEYAHRIRTQLRRLGASCDWSRERFTMDDGFSRAVRYAFVQLYREGLIYRDRYIIHWCPRCQTALADLEVEYHSVQGKLYWLRYPLVDGRGHVVVATTRPETFLGDTAVAVHPADERYRTLVGREVELPIVRRRIPIIADEAVDPEFGSGAVKVTPAHDPTDFEIARRHGLPAVEVMDETAHMNENAGPYRGLDRFEARSRIVEDLARQNLIERVEAYSYAVGHCYRCDTVVEPRLSWQWFVRMKPLAEPAIEAGERDRPRFIPPNWKATYLDWLYRIRDWCISRQIWWGHAIPAAYCDACGTTVVDDPLPKTCPSCGHADLRPDPDVLDTWFSSALWPFGVFGWPDKTPDLAVFYPTDLLVTGFDIIFFWVARMVMMGLHFTGQVPFHEVYIHGLVRDERGQKMSKTRGNVIDPMDIVQDLGADALRLTMARLVAPGTDMPFSRQQAQGYRTFMNKLWNATRFVLLQFEPRETAPPLPPPEELDVLDRWILTRLDETVQSVTAHMEAYEVNEATRKAYNFFWNDFCDWYIEATKLDLQEGPQTPAARRRKAVLVYVLDTSLRLFHPYIPFVTEELWSHLPLAERPTAFLAYAPYPTPNPALRRPDDAAFVDRLWTIVSKFRQIRAELNVPPSVELRGRLTPAPDPALTDRLVRHAGMVRFLARLRDLEVGPVRRLAGWVYDTLRDHELELEVAQYIDLERERQRLRREIQRLDQQIQHLRQRLESPAFVENAPAAIVQETRDRLAQLEDQRHRLRRYLEDLEKS